VTGSSWSLRVRPWPWPPPSARPDGLRGRPRG